MFFDSIHAGLRFIFVKPVSGQNCRSAAEAAGIVCGSDAPLIIQSQALNFRWVNGSGSISTWSWRRPGINSLAINQHGEREPIVDVLNIVPANLNFVKRVGNYQTLLKENDFGPNEDQVSGVAGHSSPSEGSDGSQKISFQQLQQRDHSSRNVNRTSVEIVASGAKHFRISHAPIVPQAMGVAH